MMQDRLIGRLNNEDACLNSEDATFSASKPTAHLIHAPC